LRVLSNPAVQSRIKTNSADCALASNGILNSVESREVHHVLHAAHFVIKHGSMCHVAKLSCDLANVAEAEHREFAAGRANEPGNNAQESALPCSVLSEDEVELTGVELCRDIANRGKAPVKS